MEPWTDYKRQRCQKKSRRRKLLEATIIIYAAFVVVIAEGITIPLAARLRRKRARNQ
jgi:hypothetical protein